MTIPALARYKINHARTFHPGDRDNKYDVRCMSGAVIDTELPGLVANYRYDPATRELLYFKRHTTRSISISQILQAIRRHYSSGHFAKKPAKARKATAGSWTAETAPKPLPGPRIARMA